MRKVTYGLHCDKGSVYETMTEVEGFEDGAPEIDNLITAMYEVIFEVDVDTGTILTVNGRELK